MRRVCSGLPSASAPRVSAAGMQIGAQEDIWAYGTSVDYMRQLCAFWLNDYDWQRDGR